MKEKNEKKKNPFSIRDLLLEQEEASDSSELEEDEELHENVSESKQSESSSDDGDDELPLIAFDHNDDADEEESQYQEEVIENPSVIKLRRQTLRQRFSRRVFNLSFVLILAFLFLLFVFIFAFRVQTITVEGNRYYSTEDIIEACNLNGYQNLYLISERDLKERVIRRYPYISDIKVTTVAPDTLILTVSEESPTYYTTVGDDYLILSQSLRVIKRYEKKSISFEDMSGIIQIVTPRVKDAYVGKELVFMREANYDYMITLISGLLRSDFYDDIDRIDVSDKFHIELILCDGRYLIQLGDNTDIDAKLDFVRAVVDKSFNDETIAKINVEYVSSVIVTLSGELFT